MATPRRAHRPASVRQSVRPAARGQPGRSREPAAGLRSPGRRTEGEAERRRRDEPLRPEPARHPGPSPAGRRARGACAPALTGPAARPPRRPRARGQSLRRPDPAGAQPSARGAALTGAGAASAMALRRPARAAVVAVAASRTLTGGERPDCLPRPGSRGCSGRGDAAEAGPEERGRRRSSAARGPQRPLSWRFVGTERTPGTAAA